jgi:Zn-dependent M28 family amino/carboxypeptidase
MFRQSSIRFLLCVVPAAFVALSLGACGKEPSAPAAALETFSAAASMQHIRTLASDEFEGRLPGGKGEELTVKYLTEQFRAMGLEPGNPDGTYVQKVPLVGITADPQMTLTLAGRGRAMNLKYLTDFVAVTKRVTESVAAEGEMIFAGYGVQAPEFNWDDFKGTDVKGKVIVVLVNDPPVPDANKPEQLDSKTFGGKAMTYYGRWSYKFEKAAQLGAAGCLIIHETGPAGYGWGVVQNSWSGEQFDLVAPDKNMGRAGFEGWITNEQAQALLKSAGKDYESLKKAAASRDFAPVPLGFRAKIAIQNKLRTVDSQNVIARINGSDEKLKNEFVIYVAHWDHLGGDGPEVNGDKIYNGALDNASGTATLLELARAYKQLKVPPRRSVLFLAVTAEEQGLIGSRHYAKNPLYAPARTAAVINMDGVQVRGRTRDITVVGYGNSTLDDVTEAVARELGRVVKPDPEPEKGFYYRSDHFEFAKEGTPALYFHSGIDFIGKPEGWGREMRAKFTAEDYHKPSDEIKPDWDLSGMVDDSKLYFLVGYRVANEPKLPEWKPGTEFKAKRDAVMRQAAATQ